MTSRVQATLNVHVGEIPTWFFADIFYELIHTIMRDNFELTPDQYTITCNGLDDDGIFN